MRRFCCAVFLASMMLTHFASAQKSDGKPTDQAKTYSQMNDGEKSRFIAAKSDEILDLFGRTEGDGINAEGLRLIRTQIDIYSLRFSSPKLDRCDLKSWSKNDLTSILMRGSKTAAAINEEFSAQNLPPQIGLYTAMIETEFCPCLPSPTGALGMFQFLASSGKDFGLKTKKNASPTNPDERCQPKLAARAAALFYRRITDRDFKSDAIGLPLAISSFNRGVGYSKRHISEVAEITKVPWISFWTLIETTELLREKFGKAQPPETPLYFQQFEMENVSYVTKFFAAAIIGENPKAFGIDSNPLSRAK